MPKIDLTTPTQKLIREMYSSNWITQDLFINGGVSMDLVLMYANDVEIIQQDPKLDFGIHRFNEVTILDQIKAYESLIDNCYLSGIDYFTEPLVNKYQQQLTLLRNLRVLLIQNNN